MFSIFFDLTAISHPEQAIPLEERESASKGHSSTRGGRPPLAHYDFVFKTYHCLNLRCFFFEN